ncbi:unnamed protein product [Eruca vesicaria subsp. sativa]|uniref:Rapid ALkalinization Factor n=1 Tax=Eruca vesicaria subsp. sativa TaxID=29727 RepID=A0ABC8JQQ4_ERUVS|nr:unnamed protein product [Eruca vesicaria subsp. sativa]
MSTSTKKNNISLIFILVIMIIMTISGFIEMGEARKLSEKRSIGYGAIGSDNVPKCSPKDPNAAGCKKTPANAAALLPDLQVRLPDMIPTGYWTFYMRYLQCSRSKIVFT